MGARIKCLAASARLAPAGERLRRAVETLGAGLLAHAENERLRELLRSEALDARGYASQLIVGVFRPLLLLLGEVEDLAYPLGEAARERARVWTVGARALIEAAAPPEGDDLWAEFGELCGLIAAETGAPRTLWSPGVAGDISGQSLANACWLRILRLISEVLLAPDADPVDLGGDAIGVAYENLLGLRACVRLESGEFSLRDGAGGSRRKRGAYYTPLGLVEHLLDSSLDPVVVERLKLAERAAGAGSSSLGLARESAILGLRACDPAVGSGRFLVATARRLGRRLAGARSKSPDDDAIRVAVGDVARSCVYGVDIDPVSVELCKVALLHDARASSGDWSVLDRRIRVGNSLLGATRERLHAGVPARSAGRTGDRERQRLLADAWCASFFTDERENSPTGSRGVITERVRGALERDAGSIAPRVAEAMERLSETHKFFHWFLEFPEVFGGQPRGGARTIDASRNGSGAQETCPCGAGAEADAGFDVVVGNPPFLNQLETETASGRGEAAMVDELSGGVARGYADTSAAFLELGTRLVRRNGRIALVQPQSLLVSKDARRVRSAVLREGSLTALWISNEHVFAGASVYTCAPTVLRSGPRKGAVKITSSSTFEPAGSVRIDHDQLATKATWGSLAARVNDTPEFGFESGGVIGDLANATADFRDQYYGLKGFLVEESELSEDEAVCDGEYPPIVTSGLIDLADCRWGESTTRILKREWRAPRIDRVRMAREGALGAWIDRRLVAKVLLATQTRVMEVFVDRRGRYVPSTPVISVTPHELERIWHVGAALASPVCTAIAFRDYGGAALSATAIKLSARQVVTLPIPVDPCSWDRAASALRSAQGAELGEEKAAHLREAAEASLDAYRVEDAQRERLLDWWLERLGSSKPRARTRSARTG